MRTVFYATLVSVLPVTGATAQDAGLLERLEALEARVLAAEDRENALNKVLMKSYLASSLPCDELPGDIWTSSEETAGRFLLGEGAGYAAGEEGGAAEIRLTIDQMPQHTHTGVFPAGPKWAMGNSPNHHPEAASGSTGPAGGSQPHQNMPPYRVVFFCRMKEGPD